MNPEPRFAWNGDSTVGYEVVVGDGPVDLMYMPGFINNLEIESRSSSTTSASSWTRSARNEP